MLVLTRKSEESIIIGNNIKIKILRIGNKNVEIGISAPSNYSIFREEVFLEIKKQNLESAKSLKKGNIENIRQIFQKNGDK